MEDKEVQVWNYQLISI